MDILIIGNGFDLAHGLPTNYLDFIDMCKYVKKYHVIFMEDKVGLRAKYKNAREDINAEEKLRLFALSVDIEQFPEFEKIVYNNFWINYFLKKKSLGDKWLNFEEEIRVVLNKIKNSEIRNNSELLGGGIDKDVDELLKEKIKNMVFYRDLYEYLIEEHKLLIRAIEIYMGSYVQYINTQKKDFFCTNFYDNILSFNYTNTYERIYNSDVKTCFIHGKACTDSHDGNNMVLGFDDHYMENTDIVSEFIPFEKYYQRIVNRNDSIYFEWLDNLEKQEEVNIHLFGHSCAPSDGDILRKFLLLNNAKTIIYCRDEIDRADKIRNLAVVLGPDNLIKLTSGKNYTISFEILNI